MIPKSVGVSQRSTLGIGSMEAPFERSFQSQWPGRCIDIVVDKVNFARIHLVPAKNATMRFVKKQQLR